MSRYFEYLQKNFDLTTVEAEEIISAMRKPLKKSIRVNTQKITLENFKLHAEEQGWTLTDTDIPEVLYIDREDTTLALGNTLEHQAGWFYIQEVSAAQPPFLLKREMEQKADSTSRSPLANLAGMMGIILDMCAAPGGKTTQLADYFPDSLVIANEMNRTRTPQLFENLDRMGYDNIAVISCDGRFLQNFPAFFDMVLLDAPCSGEGAAFRDDSVIEHWHEKNIVRIAKLQKQLFQTAVNVVRPGGFVSYSTCTLNKEENEGVITSLNPKVQIPNSKIQMILSKRYWPHIDHAGGFFASIFQKSEGGVSDCTYPILVAKGQKHIVRLATKGESETVERFVAKYFRTKLKKGYLYRKKEGIYFSRYNLTDLSQYFFFVHVGAKIGTIRDTLFSPSNHLLWHLEDISQIPILEISRNMWLSVCSREKVRLEKPDGWYRGMYGRGGIGIGKISDGVLQIS